MSASMQGAMAFQKGLGCAFPEPQPGGVNPRLHHGTLNAVFLPAVGASTRRRIHACSVIGACSASPTPGCPPATAKGTEVAEALRALNARLGLPSGWPPMGVTPDLFERSSTARWPITVHKTNPVIATRDDYRRDAPEASRWADGRFAPTADDLVTGPQALTTVPATRRNGAARWQRRWSGAAALGRRLVSGQPCLSKNVVRSSPFSGPWRRSFDGGGHGVE